MIEYFRIERRSTMRHQRKDGVHPESERERESRDEKRKERSLGEVEVERWQICRRSRERKGDGQDDEKFLERQF